MVLDASALVALYKREPGAHSVLAALASGAISVVNLSEFAELVLRLGGDEADVRIAIDALPIEVIDADAALAVDAALLSNSTRYLGLSLGDRFCLALARRMNRPALTGDRRWASIADAIGVQIELIR